MSQFMQKFLAGQVRHVLTVGAGYLVANGAITSGQENEFVSIGSGLALWAAAGVWSAIQKKDDAKKDYERKDFLMDPTETKTR